MNDHITTSAPYLVLGNVIRVHFDIESREFNGRWFTNCRAYKVEPTGQMAGQPNFAQPISPYDQQAMDAQADGYFGNLPPQADNGVTF